MDKHLLLLGLSIFLFSKTIYLKTKLGQKHILDLLLIFT